MSMEVDEQGEKQGILIRFIENESHLKKEEQTHDESSTE